MEGRRKTHRETIHGWHPYPEEECRRYSEKGLWHNLTVCDLLDRNAALFPERLAFADDRREVTWQGLRQQVDRLSLHLKEMGVGYGDFFAVQLTNIIELPCIYFALNRLGAVPIMCLPRHRRVEIDHLIRLHRARGIIVPAHDRFDYTGMVNEMKAAHPYLKLCLAAGEGAPPGWTALEDLAQDDIERRYPAGYLEQFRPVPDDICTQQLSSGTSGIPKAIPRTHNDYICQWDRRGSLGGYTDDSVPLAVVPAAHDGAFMCLIGPAIFRGASTILCQAREAEKHFEMVQKYRVTAVMLIPVQITYWMQARDKIKQYDLSSLKLVIGAADKVRPELARWVFDELKVNFMQCYGLTEGTGVWNRWDSPREAQIYTIGRPAIIDPDAIVRLVDDDNRDVPPGEIGEMVSKGPMTFKGYFRNEEANRAAFDRDGFLHSGDLMSLRPDGRYVFEGRKKEMIKRAGENVYPAAIEDKLASYKKVAYCAVIGMPDRALGEKLCAFVQPAEGETVSLEELVAYLRGQGIAVFQLPERLELVEGWPLTAKNAIDKKRLRAHITARAVQEGLISKEHGDDYLRRDKLTVDDVLQGRAEIEFTRTPV